jgi:membrane-bound lytic murein transglycosylase MltF
MLAKALNEFIDVFSLDSAIVRVINARYLKNAKYVRDAMAQPECEKFMAMVELFRKYGEQYRFDYLLMGAQAFQESRLNQNARSPVGAVGVMQLMPATGRQLKVGDITKLEPNIHGGVKYMRSIRDHYFEMDPMDDLNKGLFTFAAYNAGPNRILRLRQETKQRGLDPNVWFGNVEEIVSERIGRETVTYVSNIYKYYVAYRLLTDELDRRKDAKATVSGGR